MTMQLSCSDRVGSCRRDAGRHSHADNRAAQESPSRVRQVERAEGAVSADGGW